MNTLLFVLDQQRYTILEHNDERLYVLAELLLHEQALSFLQQELHNLSQHHGTVDKFTFERHGHIIIIKLFDALEAITQPDEPLMIDIRESELEKIIEQWKNLIKQKPHEILLTREADNFNVQPAS